MKFGQPKDMISHMNESYLADSKFTIKVITHIQTLWEDKW